MNAAVCKIEGCTRKARRRRAGLCSMHEWRKARGKDMSPLPTRRIGVPFGDLHTSPNDDCWEWAGDRRPDGYGRFKGKPAHRVSYELHVGPVPEGLVLDHLCRNRGCVNPWHLEPVTSRENTLRGETLPAINAAKTHCVNGHEFNAENTALRPNGRHRRCRACARDSAAAAYRKKRAA